MFLSECVLVYLEPEESGGVIAWAAANFKEAIFLTYEQIHPHDAFGEVMMEHLRVRLSWLLCCPCGCSRLRLCARSLEAARCVVCSRFLISLPSFLATNRSDGVTAQLWT